MYFERADSICRVDGEADFKGAGVVMVGSNTVISFEFLVLS